MPHTRSAAKRWRQSLKNNLKNKIARSEFKTQMKKILAAVSSGDQKSAQAQLPVAMKSIDKAAKAHAIHANSAARKKSQISLAVAKMGKKSGK